MSRHSKTYVAQGALGMALLFVFMTADSAHAFRAKYYKECYAPVEEVEDLVADQTNNAETIETVSEVAGYASKFGGFGGFGGLGGLGSAAKVASDVAKYSDIIGDVVAFQDQMTEDHPDPNDRWAAYGDHMTSEAHDLNKVEAAVGEAQSCYDAAYDKLGDDVASGELKSSKAKKYHKEIRSGATEIGDVLLKALDRVNQNVEAYDEALTNEAKSGGLNLGALTSMAGVGKYGYGLGGIPYGGTVSAVASGVAATAAAPAQASAEPEQKEESKTSQFGTLSQLSSLAGYAGMHAGVPGAAMVHAGTVENVVEGVGAMTGGDDGAQEEAPAADATAAAEVATDGAEEAAADALEQPVQEAAEEAALAPEPAPAPASEPVRLTEEQKAAQAMLPGLQKAGKSSQEYLALYETSLARADAQRLLELKVAKQPWE